MLNFCFVSNYSKQRGIEAKKAMNIFYYLTYFDSDDLAKIQDVGFKRELELHIADFGHCPSQLFFKPHSKKKQDSLLSQSKVSFISIFFLFLPYS